MDTAGLAACELSLTIVSDSAIRRLNRDYRRKDAPTDVLSFSQVEERGAPADPLAVRNTPGMPLGDVVISIDTAIRQARAAGISTAERLRTLLIHGFLHLIGYDHERSPADARKMFARERRLAVALEAAPQRTRSKREKRKAGKP